MRWRPLCDEVNEHMSKTPVDWIAVEDDYRTGQLSNVMLANKHGVSEGAIRKRAKQHGWVKDLTRKVQQAVRAELVRDQVRAPYARESEIIESAVATGVEVVREHRKDIRTGRSIIQMLFGELIDATNDRAEIEDAIDEECAGDENDQRRQKMLKAVALPTRAGVIRDLSTAMKNVILLERQAFNLDEQSDDDTYEERLRKLVEGEI